MTAQIIDQNGFVTIQDNPITKEGVYQYLGSEIGADEPDRVYNVYRPAEELAKEECINSFKLIPLINNHTFLGPEEIGATPAEEKGIDGVIGEDVYFDDGVTRGNLKIFSERMKKAINPENPKREIELSMAYTCWYEFTPGVFDGKKYDAIQRDLRGNHLAKVKEGRTGKDVRILDHKPTQFLKLTFDTAGILMADENEKEVVKTDITTALNKLKDMDASERDELLKGLGIKIVTSDEEVTEDEECTSDEEKTEDDATQAERDNESEADRLKREEEELKAREDREREDRDRDRAEAMDSKERIKQLEAQLKSRPTQDAIFQSMAERDRLADKVKPFIGTFDHSSMTPQGVAKYAVKKLGLKVKEGTELVALDAYMHGRTPDSQQPTATMDAAPNADADKLFSQFDEA